MFAKRRKTLIVSSAALIAAAAIFPASVGFAAERTIAPQLAPLLAYELDRIAPPSDTDAALPALGTASVDEAAQRCMAKVVHHEARNQPRAGMLAVAQTLLNRLQAGGRFGASICEVATQRGQFFDLQAYHPREDGDWRLAMDVARDTLNGQGEAVAPGALFFRSAYSPASSFFRTRQRIAAVGGQIFYR